MRFVLILNSQEIPDMCLASSRFDSDLVAGLSSETGDHKEFLADDPHQAEVDT